MKTILRALAPFAIFAAISTAPAAAADFYGKAPAYAPLSIYNWSGFYVGANLAYQWGSVTIWPSSSWR